MALFNDFGGLCSFVNHLPMTLKTITNEGPELSIFPNGPNHDDRPAVGLVGYSFDANMSGQSVSSCCVLLQFNFFAKSGGLATRLDMRHIGGDNGEDW